MDAEVAVIGLGAMGAFTLWQLAERGVPAIGIEQFTTGHDRGSSHGESRIFRTAYAEGAEYVPFLQAALPMWRQLERETGANLLIMTGGLMIGDSNGEFLNGVIQSVRAYDLPYTLLGTDEARKRYPQHRLLPGEMMVHEELAGVLRPESAVQAATARARELGAEVVIETRVESIEPADNGIEIRTTEREYKVRHAVVAVGAWTGKLLSVLDLPLWVERQVMVWFGMRQPEMFTPETFPIFLGETHGGNWYGLPSMDGVTVKVALHHFGGRRSDPDALDREIYPDDLDLISRVVRERLPDLDPTPIRAQVCMYTNTPDEGFIIGPAPGMSGVTVLGGMSGHGFKFAPIVGKLAAEIALDGKASMSIEQFSPTRFAGIDSLSR